MGRKKKTPLKLLGDDDDDSAQNRRVTVLDVDEQQGQRLLYTQKRKDLERHDELVRRGVITDEKDPNEVSSSESEPDEDLENPQKDIEFIDLLIKVKKQDPSIKNEAVKLSYGSDKKKEKEKKKKKMYLKDVQAQHLLDGGSEYVEEEEKRRIRTYAEEQEDLRKAVIDAAEAGYDGSDDEDGEDLFTEIQKEGDDDDDVEASKKLAEKLNEYFDGQGEIYENQFLKEYFEKQMWKDKDLEAVDPDLDDLTEDEDLVSEQEEYETNYRHQENAGEIVMGQSRIVEGSVRKKDNARKDQRKNKEERLKMAEIERKEELKRLKNVKKKEIKEKMKRVLSVAGFKDGEECPLDARDLDDEFDPLEYDKMMKAAFDDKYYGAEDSDLNSDEDHDDGGKPDFEKEDELLGLPKDWDVIQGGDGFVATREKALKHKENGSGDDNEEEEPEEPEVDEEKESEGKRKRKRKTSLVQKAKEAMMEEYYKLDYEDTIGDLKTRFKYAKVQPNRYALETEEIFTLDDAELNQYVPLKKMAPYVEKDWEVNKYKVKEQKLKIKELMMHGKSDDKRSNKRKKTDVVAETKPTEKAEEEVETDESKLSRKAKRRRRQAEKKLPPSRMAAYGKA